VRASGLGSRLASGSTSAAVAGSLLLPPSILCATGGKTSAAIVGAITCPHFQQRFTSPSSSSPQLAHFCFMNQTARR
jgi:hypothetical protein